LYIPWNVSHTIHGTGFVNVSEIAKHVLFRKPSASARYDEDAQNEMPLQTMKIGVSVTFDTTHRAPDVAIYHQPRAA
jgi:hypothetical protein